MVAIVAEKLEGSAVGLYFHSMTSNNVTWKGGEERGHDGDGDVSWRGREGRE